MNHGFIYFIQRGDGPIKVGHSSDPARRLITLQAGHFERLHLIGYTEGSRFDEGRIHVALREWALGREWYAPDAPVGEHIETPVPPGIVGALDSTLDAKARIHEAVRALRLSESDAACEALAEAHALLGAALSHLSVTEEAAA